MFLLWVAMLMSVTTFFVHVVVGGKFVAAPLLETDALPPASKWLNYYCWHVTSIVIAFIAFAFGWMAMNGSDPAAIIFLAGLTASLAVLSAAVALKGDINPFRFPSTSLFAAISLAGWGALL